MKTSAHDFLTHKFHFDSRIEVDCFLWFAERDFEVEPHPGRLVGWNDQIWSPDFRLRKLNVYIELKPSVHYWHETQRIKPVVYASIQSGSRFWVWLVVWEQKRPRIYEQTRFDPESKDSEEKQMQRFYICDPPVEVPFGKKDPQLLLF